MTVCIDTNTLVQLVKFADCAITANADFLIPEPRGTCGLPLRGPLGYALRHERKRQRYGA